MTWPVKLIVFLLALLVLYVAECLVWPYVRCPRCGGRGEHQEWWNVRAWRDCSLCGGRGKRFRAGRRIFNYVVRRRREAR